MFCDGGDVIIMLDPNLGVWLLTVMQFSTNWKNYELVENNTPYCKVSNIR